MANRKCEGKRCSNQVIKQRVPPGYISIGKCNKFFPKASVVSIKLNKGLSIVSGAKVAIRLVDRYHEEEVTSMQINGQDVAIARAMRRWYWIITEKEYGEARAIRLRKSGAAAVAMMWIL